MSRAAPQMLQDHGEFAELLKLYRERQPKRVLEIGVGMGGTLYHWLRHAAAGARVVAVDDHHREAYRYDSWLPPEVDLLPIMGDSTHMDTIEQVAEHSPFDWVFIDANHHELHVRADWQHYGQTLATPDAIVALHDVLPTSDPTIEVDYLWREIEREHDTHTISCDGGHGIGVVYRGRRA